MDESINEYKSGEKSLRFFQTPLVRVITLTILIIMLLVASALILSRIIKQRQNHGIDSYIYPVGTQSILDMKLYKDGLAVLQSNSLVYIDSGGNQIAATNHTFASPVLRSAGAYVLLFDRGADGLRIDKKASVVTEKHFSSNLVNADICRNGTYAYLLNADDGYQSHLLVCSRKNDKIFEWGSSTDFATLVHLASNGKRAALVSFGVDNAQPYSKVSAFDFSKSEALFSVLFPNTVIFDVTYITSNEIAVFADTGVYRINKDGSYESLYAYSPAELNCASAGNEKFSGVTLNLYGNERTPQTVIFDKKFKNRFEFPCDEKVNNLYTGDSFSVVSAGKTIYTIDSKNTVRRIQLSDDCIKCVVKNKTVFALRAGGISAFSAKTGETVKG